MTVAVQTGLTVEQVRQMNLSQCHTEIAARWNELSEIDKKYPNGLTKDDSHEDDRHTDDGHKDDGQPAARDELHAAPPFLTWRAIYAVVLGALALQVIVYAVLTAAYR